MVMVQRENDIAKLRRTLCPHCLGRLFGKLGHGLTNPQRARAIAILREKGPLSGGDLASFAETLGRCASVTMDGNDRDRPASGEPCYVCSNLFEEIPGLAQLAVRALKDYEFDNFQIGVRVDPEIVRKEEALWSEINATFQEPIKAELNREIGKVVASMLQCEVEFAAPQAVAVIDTAFDHVDVQISPIFLYGRYRKLKRGIPQTKWPCRNCRGRGCQQCNDTGKQYPETVEELISDRAQEIFLGTGAKFHGMGREDIDARMLGRGRPFVLEIKKPRKRKTDLLELAENINSTAAGKVEVLGLRWAERDTVKRVKESRFPKVYSARIGFNAAVSKARLSEVMQELSGTIIEQKTPKRVSHRRADLIRKRKVFEAALVEFDEEEGLWCVITVKGEAGLYIKELIHSDEGRTKPSLGGLLSENADLELTVESLDVMDVCDQGEEIVG